MFLRMFYISLKFIFISHQKYLRNITYEEYFIIICLKSEMKFIQWNFFLSYKFTNK